MNTKFDTRQSENRRSLSVFASAVNTTLDVLLSDINAEFDVPLRLFATLPPNQYLNIRSSLTTTGDGGQKSAPPLSSFVITFPDSTINFQTGATTGGVFIPNSGPNTLTLPTSTIGNYIRVGFTLLSSGSVQVLFSPQSVTLIGLANAGTLIANNGIPIGWIDLQATGATAYKTAGSSSNIIENAPGGTAAIHRFDNTLLGNGTGTGSGVGDDLDSLNYNASFRDTFDSIPSSAGAVNVSAGFTDPSLYSTAGQLYTLHYDASKTVTGTSTTMVLSGAPAYTIKVGDILIVNGYARKITALSSQTNVTIEAAFPTNPTAAACNVSQTVYTVDLNHYNGTGTDGNTVASIYTDNIDSVLIDYSDVISGTVFDPVAVHIAYVASSDGTNYSAVSTRTASFSSTEGTLSLPTSSTNLFLRFFSNATSGNGTVNFLDYKVFFHTQTQQNTGFSSNQAYCFTDGSGTALNCQTPTVVGGKTQIVLNFTYVPGLNAGLANGQLEIFINGQKIPRFISGDTPDAYYTEVDSSTIQLDSNYSGFNFAVEILKPIALQDTGATNSLRLVSIYDAIVGNATQVASGQATHTSLTAALAAVPNPGGRIFILNYTSTETVNIAQNVYIEGRGFQSVISGNITFASGSSYGVFKNVQVNGSVVFNAGTTAIFFTENWLTTGMTVTDNGTGNYKLYTVG